MGTYGSHRSFWLSELTRLACTDPLAGEHSTDVAVIGGGYTGLSAALNLRRLDPNVRVTLLEAEHVAFGASGRNSGYVWPNVTTYGYLRRIFGLARARAVFAYAARSCDYVAELIQSHALDSEYRRPGAIHAALGARYQDEIRARLDLARTLGDERGQRELSRADVRQQIDSPLLHSGFFDPDVAYIHPAKHAQALLRLAQGAGVVVHEMSPAIAFARGPRRMSITTPGGRLLCDRVVLATNAYSHLLVGLDSQQVRRHQYPVFVHSEVTAPLSSAAWQASGWRTPSGLITAGPINHFMHRTLDGRIHWGCDVYFDIPAPTQMSLDYLPGYSATMGQHLEQFFPSLAPLRPVQQWGGPVAITPDGLPHIGFVEDERVLLAAGCNGNGVALAHLNGRTAAELVLGRESADTETWFVRRRPWRWPGQLLASLTLRAYSHHLRRTARRRVSSSTIGFRPPYHACPDGRVPPASHT